MILVCGGAGYIGSHMVQALIEAGESVVVVDNLSTGHQMAVHPKAHFVCCDIRDEKSLNVVFSEYAIDAVIHFAAASLVGESIENPLKYYDNNVGGSRTLLESMTSHGVKHIVFSSTAAVYGIPEKSPIIESDSTNPINPYGETKLAVERMLSWADKAHDIKSVCLRYFNVAGAHQVASIGEAHYPETHLLPLILQVANKQRESIAIFGQDYHTPDGTCVRDYIHVEDLIAAHILALKYLRKQGKSDVFNLGNGSGFSVFEMINCARKVTNHEIPQNLGERRPGDPDILVASSEKAKAILGWSPKYPDLESIIESAWRWHSHHPNGYTSD